MEGALPLKNVSILLVAGAVGLAVLAGCGPQTKAERGVALFKTCVPCHGPDGGGDLALRAPQIAGLPQWYVARELDKFAHDIRGAHPDDMEGHRMRPMARTLYRPGDIEAVSAHVAAMPFRDTPPSYPMADTADGHTRYGSICFTCHQADAMGNEALGAPKLVGQWDWYMMAQLEKFHSGMRGAHPEDTTGAQMRAMSMTLEDTTAMHNVVSYIKTLPTR
jgi:cytochrome c553